MYLFWAFPRFSPHPCTYIFIHKRHDICIYKNIIIGLGIPASWPRSKKLGLVWFGLVWFGRPYPPIQNVQASFFFFFINKGSVIVPFLPHHERFTSILLLEAALLTLRCAPITITYTPLLLLLPLPTHSHNVFDHECQLCQPTQRASSRGCHQRRARFTPQVFLTRYRYC